MAEDLENKTVPELQDELRSRDLSVSGTKPELIERLTAADADQVADDTARTDRTDTAARDAERLKAAGKGGPKSADKDEVDRTFGRTVQDADTLKEAGAAGTGPTTGNPESAASKAAEAAALDVANNAEYADNVDGT